MNLFPIVKTKRLKVKNCAFVWLFCVKMKIFTILLIPLLATLGSCGYLGIHDVVTPDILHHVSKVLSHGYGTKVVLGYPQKAHLVDYGHSVQPSPYYGHGYGHHHHHHGGHYAYPAFAHGGHGHGFGHGYGYGHYPGYQHHHY